MDFRAAVFRKKDKVLLRMPAAYTGKEAIKRKKFA